MAPEKSIFTREYAIFLATLRRLREDAGVTQAAVAAAMGRDQSVVSKCERGERRLDMIETYYYCQGIEMNFDRFTAILMEDMQRAPRPKKRSKR